MPRLWRVFCESSTLMWLLDDNRFKQQRQDSTCRFFIALPLCQSSGVFSSTAVLTSEPFGGSSSTIFG